MVKCVADENFNRSILTGLFRHHPELDIVRVQDVGLGRADDRKILEWAAREGRIILTHDVNTMVALAYQRIVSGEGMPGVVAVRQAGPIGPIINDLLLLIAAGIDDDLVNRVVFVPL